VSKFLTRGAQALRRLKSEIRTDRNRTAEGEWIKRVGTDGLANAVTEILKR
jgi:hypothetical protein